MSKEKAKAHYLGLPGYQRLNCGQSIIEAFKEKFGLDAGIVNEFKNYGGGRAPDGVCGAYFAAVKISHKFKGVSLDTFEKELINMAGSTKCRQIRGLAKLSCLGCVEKIAQMLEGCGGKI